MIDPDYRGEIGFSLHSGGEKGFVQNVGDPLGGLGATLSCNCSQTTKSNSVRMTKGSDSSGMKVQVTPPRKEPGSAGVLAESGGNTEWVVEAGSFKHQVRPHGQLQKSGVQLT